MPAPPAGGAAAFGAAESFQVYRQPAEAEEAYQQPQPHRPGERYQVASPHPTAEARAAAEAIPQAAAHPLAEPAQAADQPYEPELGDSGDFAWDGPPPILADGTAPWIDGPEARRAAPGSSPGRWVVRLIFLVLGAIIIGCAAWWALDLLGDEDTVDPADGAVPASVVVVLDRPGAVEV
jgi:hypothetical protein